MRRTIPGYQITLPGAPCRASHAPATIRSDARDILLVASRIEMTPDGGASRAAIEAAVDQWISKGSGKSPSVRKRIVNATECWPRFSGLFVETQQPRMAAGGRGQPSSFSTSPV
jgi:hypothetical protein